MHRRRSGRGGALRGLQLAALGGLVVLLVAAGQASRAAERPGVPPEGPWACPATHPIKGYVSQESGRRVFFLPGSRFYDEASPERCYTSEDEARRDGGGPAHDPRPAPPREGLVTRFPE